MANFGWAYVAGDCEHTSGSGPTGSLQFISGALGHTTGSWNLRFHTGSKFGEQPYHLILSGNLTVTGAISASALHYEDITHIDATGSTFFGNSRDDIHSRTGSLEMWGADDANNVVVVLTASSYSGQTFVRGFGGRYVNVTSSHHTASTDEYILGVTATETAPDNIFITIPSASIYGAGAVVVIKDQVTAPRGLSNITLTCSAGAGYKFDGDTTYILTGTMPAISLYSNGSNWFVF